MIVGLLIGAVILACIILMVSYNSLVAAGNQVDNANGAIDAMLKKRYDLLPNLVELVKQYMNYEQSTLTRITELRAKAISDNAETHEKVEADSQASSLLNKVIFSAENYPILQANVNFLHLQETWTDAEENISAARRAYNAAVTEYNNSFEVFPGNLFAKMLNFAPKKIFEAKPEERENISAKALFNA
jgi:LemA protein